MIRIETLNDIDELMRWREEVIVNVFGLHPSHDLLAANREYYSQALPSGEHLALVAVDDKGECGCGGVCFSMELPSPDNPSGRCAYLMNIYVRDAFRNNGIAHRIVTRLIAEAKARNCGKIYLETTADGKPVYRSLGFRDMPDMMKYYDTDDKN